MIARGTRLRWNMVRDPSMWSVINEKFRIPAASIYKILTSGLQPTRSGFSVLFVAQ